MTDGHISEDALIETLKLATASVELQSERIREINTLIHANGTESRWIAATLARKIFLETKFNLEHLEDGYWCEVTAGDYRKLGFSETAEEAINQAATKLVDAFLREESPLGIVPDSPAQRYTKIIQRYKTEIIYLLHWDTRISKTIEIVNKHWGAVEIVKYIADYNYETICYNNTVYAKYQGTKVYFASAIIKGRTHTGVGQTELEAKIDLNFHILDRMLQNRFISDNFILEHPQYFVLPPIHP